MPVFCARMCSVESVCVETASFYPTKCSIGKSLVFLCTFLLYVQQQSLLQDLSEKMSRLFVIFTTVLTLVWCALCVLNIEGVGDSSV